MAMDLLRQIACSPSPKYFTSPEEIDKVRILCAAGLVIAVMPTEAVASAASVAPGAERSARVIAITQKGREELQRHGGSDEQLQGAASTADVVGRLRDIVDRARRSLRD